jgi:hypothetical protein
VRTPAALRPLRPLLSPFADRAIADRDWKERDREERRAAKRAATQAELEPTGAER